MLLLLLSSSINQFDLLQLIQTSCTINSWHFFHFKYMSNTEYDTEQKHNCSWVRMFWLVNERHSDKQKVKINYGICAVGSHKPFGHCTTLLFFNDNKSSLRNLTGDVIWNCRLTLLKIYNTTKSFAKQRLRERAALGLNSDQI